MTDIPAQSETTKQGEGDNRIIPAKGGFAAEAGQWALEHKDMFNKNSIGWYGVRNVAGASVGLTALALAYVPVMRGMAALTRATAGSENVAVQTTHKLVSSPIFRNFFGIGTSFAVYRTIHEAVRENYDRVFTNADSPEASAQAIHDLPKNMLGDIGRILPTELPATIIAAVSLVAGRMALTRAGWRYGGYLADATWQKMGKTEELAKKVKEGTEKIGFNAKHFLHDHAAQTIAYTAFLETVERLGKDWRGENKGEDRSKQNASPVEEKHYAMPFFQQDGVGRVLFRQVPAIALGMLPYVAGQHLCYNRPYEGEPFSKNKLFSPAHPVEENFMRTVPDVKERWKNDIASEWLPYQGFAAYTLISELWRNGYDAVFDNIQKKYDNHCKQEQQAEILANLTPEAKIHDITVKGRAVNDEQHRLVVG